MLLQQRIEFLEPEELYKRMNCSLVSNQVMTESHFQVIYYVIIIWNLKQIYNIKSKLF